MRPLLKNETDGKKEWRTTWPDDAWNLDNSIALDLLAARPRGTDLFRNIDLAFRLGDIVSNKDTECRTGRDSRSEKRIGVYWIWNENLLTPPRGFQSEKVEHTFANDHYQSEEKKAFLDFHILYGDRRYEPRLSSWKTITHTVIAMASETTLEDEKQLAINIMYHREKAELVCLHHDSSRVDGIGHKPSNNIVGPVR